MILMLPVAPNGTDARRCLQIGCRPIYHASTPKGKQETPTSVSGRGSLINLHEKSTSNALSTAIVQLIGALAVVISICTIVFSTISYVMKTKQINEQTFRPSRPLIWLLASLLLLITGLFGYYFLPCFNSGFLAAFYYPDDREDTRFHV